MANPDHTNPDRPNFPLPVDSEHKATFHLHLRSRAPLPHHPRQPQPHGHRNRQRRNSLRLRRRLRQSCDGVHLRHVRAPARLLLLVSPAVYCFSIINSAASFLVVRLLVGFSLATFVATQFWMSSMFSTTVVGTANAVSAGWGNFGGGATQIIMPYVFSIILDMGAVRFTAWRFAFFIPALMQTTSAFSIFFLAQDLPDGNFTDLKKSGEKHRDKISRVFRNAATNCRVWILALTYGYCFGVGLTVDNIIAQYFYDRFNVNLHTAGIIAASFGLANIFSRPTGGIISDAMAKRFGMRGRLWVLWTVQSLGGLLCIVLGRVGSLGASIAPILIKNNFKNLNSRTTRYDLLFVSKS
ncbi:hypothetical protein ACSBR2_006643 [Camellia fascicularis]